MANISNNYASGSCVFEAGSSQNGDVTITGPVYQGGAKPGKECSDGSLDIGSPLHLSSSATKIDLIRLMNAWYECGKVDDGFGGRPTKKEFFTWVGKLFNINLANYDKDLSNSMATGVTIDKQLGIFRELQDRHEQIYSSK